MSLFHMLGTKLVQGAEEDCWRRCERPRELEFSVLYLSAKLVVKNSADLAVRAADYHIPKPNIIVIGRCPATYADHQPKTNTFKTSEHIRSHRCRRNISNLASGKACNHHVVPSHTAKRVAIAIPLRGDCVSVFLVEQVARCNILACQCTDPAHGVDTRFFRH